ncbi:protocadherin-15-like [Fundulus heteroclitus]|uniref:protocadherin-15-like n=1 Tax=Fundulus heteroclitus TaxID=8078 RepID=UPI00165A8E28|nr:protocadherin-15-like [Fundulus heteroclitus]
MSEYFLSSHSNNLDLRSSTGSFWDGEPLQSVWSLADCHGEPRGRGWAGGADDDEGFVEEEAEDLSVAVLYDPEHSSVQQASSSSSSAPSTSSRGDLRQRLSHSPLPPPPPPPLLPPPLPPPLLQHPVQPSGASGPAASAGSSVADQAPAAVLGPDGIPGWDKVQDLAEYLVSLRQALYVDEQQVRGHPSVDRSA